ncbi:hypothetical protein BsWGS_07521 [Bradybaena similaris]
MGFSVTLTSTTNVRENVMVFSLLEHGCSTSATSVTCYYGADISCTATHIMDVIQSMTVQLSPQEGYEKKELRLHRSSSGNAINTSASDNQLRMFDVIVLPGGNQAGVPFIGITEGIKYSEASPKPISSCRKDRYHRFRKRRYHRLRKSAGFNTSLFTDRVPCLSAPSRVQIAAETDQLAFPVQADLRATKNSNGVWRSKSEHTIISVRPAVTNSSTCQGVSDDWCVQAAGEVSDDPLFHYKTGITRGSYETCNLIRSKPQRDTNLSPHFEAGNFEFVFVTYDMEEPEQPPQPDLENTNNEFWEEYDPFYKCAFQFARKHGYGFVEFVEEKVLDKKPKKRIMRKKNQTFFMTKDDRVNPVYFVSSSSKKRRVRRDRCIVKPKVKSVALSKETSPFKLVSCEKANEKNRFPGVAKRVQTKSLPVKIPLPQSIDQFPTCRKMHSVTGPLMTSSIREGNLIDQDHVSQESPSLPNDVGKYATDRYLKGVTRAGTTLTKVSARSPSAIVGDALNTPNDICQIVKRPAQSLDCKTLDNTLDIFKEPELHGSYSKKQNKSQENIQAVPGTNTSAENLYNMDEQIAGVSKKEPSLEKQSEMILPGLKDATSLEYKLCNSMSALIFQESQLAQKVAMRKHLDKLPLANVDVVQIAYQPVHGENSNRTPSNKGPTRQRRSVHKVFKSPHCMLPAGSSVNMCAGKKAPPGAHADQSSQVPCDRVGSWPRLVPRNPKGLSRNPEAKIYTCQKSPPIAKLISTVGDSPTVCEFNSDSFSKTAPQFAVINLGKGVNEQGLDLKQPTDSNLREIIFPASVPQVREHLRLRHSPGSYNFEDNYIGKQADSSILYSSKSCKTLTEGKSRIATQDKAPCGKRSATSTTRQGSVNNNKCPGYTKELADIYGECSYSQGASSYNESPDPSSSQDTNNNAVLQVAGVNTSNTNQGYVIDNVCNLLGSDCNQTDGKRQTLCQKHQLMRLPVVFELHEQIFPDSESQLHTCIDPGEIIPPVTTAISYKEGNKTKKQQRKNRSANKYKSKKTLAYLSTGCKNLLKVCNCYAKNTVRRLKEKKPNNLSIPSTSQPFRITYKKSECSTDWLADCQYATALDANNNSNARKKRPVVRKSAGRHPRTRKTVRRKDSLRLTRRKSQKQKIARGRGGKIARYSITDKGLTVLREKQNETVTYSIGPLGYRKLYENLQQRCSTSPQLLAPAKCVDPRAVVDPSCDVLESMVDSFRRLITMFPEKRLVTLQKILGLTESPRFTESQTSHSSTESPRLIESQTSHSSTESRCSCSISNLRQDANMCNSPTLMCKQRPGTIYQSVAPNPNTWWNNTINPLSKGYSTTSGSPDLMTGPIQLSPGDAMYDDISEEASSVDLVPVDSLTVYREQWARRKQENDAKQKSKSNKESGKACCEPGTNDTDIISSSHAINEVLASPILDQTLSCQNVPLTQQHGNGGALSGIQKLEGKSRRLKKQLQKSILLVHPAIDNTNYQAKTIEWISALGNDDDSFNDDEENNDTRPSELLLPAPDTNVSDSLTMNSYFTEGSNPIAVISRQPLLSESNLQQMANPTCIDSSSCNTQGPNCTAFLTPCSTTSVFSSPRGTNSGPANISSNTTQEFHCTTDAIPALFNTSWQEGSVTEDQQHIPSSNPEANLLDVVNSPQFASQTYNPRDERISPTDENDLNLSSLLTQPYLKVNSPGISTHWICVVPEMPTIHLCASASGTFHIGSSDNNSTSQCCPGAEKTSSQASFNMTVFTRSQNCQNQFSSTNDESNEPESCNQSVAAASSSLKVNTSSTTIFSDNQTSCSNSQNQLSSANDGSGEAESCNQGLAALSSSLEVNTSYTNTSSDDQPNSNNTRNQLSSANDESGEAESCNQGLAASSSPDVNTNYTTSEDQPSSSNSVTMSASTSQFNNNNNILPSLPLLLIPELRVQGDHLETVWRICRHQLQGSVIEGTLTTAIPSNERNVRIGISAIGVPLINRYNDHETLIHEKDKEVFTGNTGSSLRENNEGLLSGKLENFITGNKEDLIIGRNCNMLAARNADLLSGNNEDVLAGSHESFVSGNYESFLSINRKDVPSRKPTDLHNDNYKYLHSGHHENTLSRDPINIMNYDHLLNGKSETVFNGTSQNVFNTNHESMLSANDENGYSRKKGDLHSERSGLQLSVNNNAWRDLNPKLRCNEEQGITQAATSNVLNSKTSQTVSRKRRIIEPLEDMASAPKIRRLNSSLPQPVYQRPTCQKNLAGPYQHD